MSRMATSEYIGARRRAYAETCETTGAATTDCRSGEPVMRCDMPPGDIQTVTRWSTAAGTWRELQVDSPEVLKTTQNPTPNNTPLKILESSRNDIEVQK